MSRHRVMVELFARTLVEIEVEAHDDEDPCDLTRDEMTEAVNKASRAQLEWEIDGVTLADSGVRE